MVDVIFESRLGEKITFGNLIELTSEKFVSEIFNFYNSVIERYELVKKAYFYNGCLGFTVVLYLENDNVVYFKWHSDIQKTQKIILSAGELELLDHVIGVEWK